MIRIPFGIDSQGIVPSITRKASTYDGVQHRVLLIDLSKHPFERCVVLEHIPILIGCQDVVDRGSVAERCISER